MLIFLYGIDSYRRQEKLKEITADYKKKHFSFALENFNLEKGEDFDKFKDFTKAQSLFDSLKLGIVYNGSSLEKTPGKEYIALLKENIKSKELVLVILENKAPTKDFKFLLEKPILSQEFENLTGVQLQLFLENQLKNRGLIFDKESKDLILQVYGGDSWGLITELDKLALLDEKSITARILESHWNVFLPLNIFSAVNQIRNSKNISSRLSLLETLLSRGEDPAMIFNIVAVSPYADDRWKEKAADYDVAIKSGKLEYEEVLTDLAISD